MNFKAFAREVDAVMLYVYGIDWSDACGEMDYIKNVHSEGTAPWQFVMWWGEKYDLTPIHEFTADAAWGVSLDEYRRRNPATDRHGKAVRPKQIHSIYD